MNLNRLLPALCGTALFALVGCQAVPPPEPEKASALAAGLGEPIVFRTDAGLLDEPRAGDAMLTRGEAVQLTARRDAKIQASLARVRIAEAESDQAHLLPNPVVSVALRFPTSGSGKPVIDAGLAAELVSILQRPGRVSAADNRLRAESANAVATVLDVLTEVRESYAAVQALDELLIVQEDRRSILDRLLELARARLKAGEGTQLDVTTFETQRVELETEIADKELERQQERLTLTRLIGEPSGDATWKVSKWEAPPATTASEHQWVSLALEKRPEVSAKLYELSALGAERRLTRFSPFDSAELGAAAEKDPDWTVGPEVSLPIPLFDMGQAARARANAAVVEARHNLLEAQREAVEETRRAFATHRSSKENLARVQKELLPLQEKRLLQAEAQYRAGLADITTLFLAEQDLRSARARLIELQQRVSESLIRLERSAGGSGVARSAFGDPSATAPVTN